MRKPSSTALLPDSGKPPAVSASRCPATDQRTLCHVHTWLRCGLVRRSLAVACVLTLGLSVLLWVGPACTSGVASEQPRPELVLHARLRLPRIVHFTSHSEMLRAEYRPLMQSWLDANPNLQFYLWRDTDAACLARLHYPRWNPALNGSGRWLQTPLERSDLTRILALHSLGGLYLDLDTQPVGDIGHLFDQPLAGAMFATEPPEHATLVFGLQSLISNAVMFSVPGHPYLAAYMDAIEAIVRTAGSHKRSNLNAPETTGPLVMQRAYEAYRSDEEVACSSADCRVHLFRPEVFSPVHDLHQTWNLKNICNATTLASLPAGRRNVCVQLWARNFTQAKVTYETIGIHLFSHLSSFSANPEPTFFNARVAFPRLQFFADTVRSC